MRIRVFDIVDAAAHKPDAYSIADDKCRLSVRVWHAGIWYELALDQKNRLRLRAIDATLVIRPEASNLVQIDAESPYVLKGSK